MHKRDILEDDDRVLGGVLLQEVLEVGAAGAQYHLVGLGVLALGGYGHVTEGLFVPQVLERCHHVSLEVVPTEAKLLVVSHCVDISTIGSEILHTKIEFHLIPTDRYKRG